MVKQFNMHEAKTNFSKLAKMVEAGEEVVIARKGVPLMKMVLIEEVIRPPRDFSRLQGLVTMTTDQTWEEIDEEILASLKYSDWEDE
jgi:antitoxin (DNA-binding transcriptional repressor) of toxin-antitoxin stability system